MAVAWFGTCTLWSVLALSAAQHRNNHHDREQVLQEMGVTLDGRDSPVGVTSVIGSSVALPCNLTSTLDEDHVRLVLWFKEGSAKPVYTYDTRGKIEKNASHWSDRKIFEGRAFFQEWSGRLVLDNIQPHDQGKYKCRVDFKRAPTNIYQINLNVILPPEKPKIFDNNEEVRLKLGPYKIGESVVIECSSLGGRPSPSVSWWRDHRLVDNSYSQVSHEKVSNFLQLTSLRREDLHSILTCQASNNNMSVPVSTSVKLDMTFGPTSVEILGQKESISAGVRYVVDCRSIGARPSPLITWSLGDRNIGSDAVIKTSYDGNVTVSTIELTATKADDGLVLRCNAGLPNIPRESLNAQWKLRVTSAPTVHLSLESANDISNIQEGENVVFNCNIEANPPPHAVIWKKDGVTLKQSEAEGFIMKNHSLIVREISRINAGSFTCQADNKEGHGESNPIEIDIKFAPVCSPGQKVVYGVAPHELSHVTCQVFSNPSANLTFQWIFNTTTERLDIQNSQFSSKGTKSIVEYIPRTEMDYGSLLCWATNTVGRQESPCVYHLIPAGQPDPVNNCSINNQSHSSFSLDCQSGFDGGLHQTFVMEVTDSEAGYVVTNMSSQTPSFSVNGLQSGKTFLIKVYSANDKGQSDPISVTAFTMEAKEAGLRSDSSYSETGLLKTKFAITPILGVLIGVGAALGLVSISIIAIICLRTTVEDKSRAPVQSEAEAFMSKQRNTEEENHFEFNDAEAGFNQDNERKYSTMQYSCNSFQNEYATLNNQHFAACGMGPEHHYTQLSLPRCCMYTPIRPQPQPIYAKIDPSKKKPRHHDLNVTNGSFNVMNISSDSSNQSPGLGCSGFQQVESCTSDISTDEQSNVSAETPLVSNCDSDERSSNSSSCRFKPLKKESSV